MHFHLQTRSIRSLCGNRMHIAIGKAFIALSFWSFIAAQARDSNFKGCLTDRKRHPEAVWTDYVELTKMA